MGTGLRASTCSFSPPTLPLRSSISVSLYNTTSLYTLNCQPVHQTHSLPTRAIQQHTLIQQKYPTANMKYSQVLASVLFGSMAAAIPFKRDLVTKTEIAIETVIVYTTVWEDDVPVAEATTTAGGYFYEQPTAEAETTPAATSTPAYTPAPVQEPSTPAYTPPVKTSAAPAPPKVEVSSAAPVPEPIKETSAAPATSTVEAPAAPTTTEAPAAPTTTEASAAPTTTEAPAYTPAPVTTVAPAPATTAAAAPSYSSGSSSTGENFSGVDLTINPLTGALGACGEPMHATDMYVAIASSAWGASTYDTMTGQATNKWCGQKVRIEYNGKSVDAKIMDMCPGCAGHDLDLSDAAWAAIGMTEWTRVKGSWSMI